jgi:TP901 family phage tail tape measure protein
MSGQLDAFAGKVQTATQPLADMSDKILKIEAALAALVAGGLFLSLRAYSDFETASAELNKVLDSNTESLGEAQESAKELALRYGESATDILASFANFRQAGFDLNESMTLTKDALDLVIAGDVDMHEASEILISTLKGLKLGFEDGRTAIDNMNEVSNNYATNVRELGLGMKELSPIAKLMGFSMEEMIGILTPVIEVFRSGSEAGTAMRTTLLKLVDDAKPVQEAMKVLGVTQKDANGQFRSGRDILYDVMKAFQGLNENEKVYVATQLTGIRQASKAVEVFNQIDYVLGVVQTQMGATGSATREVEIRLQTLEVQSNRFIAAIQDLGIEVGGSFSEAATEVTKASTEITQTLSGMVSSGTFAPIFDLINSFSFDLAANLRQIAEVMPEAFANVDWSRLIDSLKGLGGEIEDVFKAFFGDIDLTTAEGLEDFIQKLVDSFTGLTNVAKGIINALEPFIKILGEMLDKFAASDADAQDFIGSILGLGKAINVLSGYVPILTGFLSLLADAFLILTVIRIPGTVAALSSTGAAMLPLVVILGKLSAAVAAFGAGWLIGDWLADTFPVVDKFGKGLADMVLSVQGLGEAQIRAKEDQAAYNKALGDAAAAAAQASAEIDAIPTEKEIGIDIALQGFFTDIDQAKYVLDNMPDEKKVEVKGGVDKASIQAAADYVINTIPGEMKADGTQEMITEIVFNPELGGLDETKKALEEVPSEKIIIARMDNQTKIAIEEIKAAAATVQTAIEWKAKIEIAEVEQVFETLRTQSESIRDMFLDTGEVLTAMFGAFEHLGPLGKSDLLALMEKELNIRASLAEAQSKLTDAEIRYLDAKTKAMEQGTQGLINITMDGVYPELELIMHKIIERTQVRATAEGLEFLLGV